MKKSHVILSIIIFATFFVVSCDKDNETTYDNLQGEWYSKNCDRTIIFTSVTTLTMIFESIDEEHKCNYSIQPEGMLYITYAGTLSEHKVEFVNNRKIIIDNIMAQ